MPEERLQKLLAAAGVGSRRACETLITAGRVRVNGEVVTVLGSKADPTYDQITVDGKPLRMPTRHVYVKLHKPRGILGDIGGHDPEGRPTVASLLPAHLRRVFPVGRLDFNSEGLVLLTDDGEMAHRLTHPRYEHPKTYYVLVEERPGEAALAQLRGGVDLPEGRTAPARVEVVERLPAGLTLERGRTAGVWLEVVLREGKKRQIRQMTAAVGLPTLRLVRWAIGPLTLADLRPGENALLSRGEVGALRQLAAGPARLRADRDAPTAPRAERAPRRSAAAAAPGRRVRPRDDSEGAPDRPARAGRTASGAGRSRPSQGAGTGAPRRRAPAAASGRPRRQDSAEDAAGGSSRSARPARAAGSSRPARPAGQRAERGAAPAALSRRAPAKDRPQGAPARPTGGAAGKGRAGRTAGDSPKPPRAAGSRAKPQAKGKPFTAGKRAGSARSGAPRPSKQPPASRRKPAK